MQTNEQPDELGEYMENVRRLSKLSKEKIEVEKKVGHKTSKLKLPKAEKELIKGKVSRKGSRTRTKLQDKNRPKIKFYREYTNLSEGAKKFFGGEFKSIEQKQKEERKEARRIKLRRLRKGLKLIFTQRKR